MVLAASFCFLPCGPPKTHTDNHGAAKRMMHAAVHVVLIVLLLFYLYCIVVVLLCCCCCCCVLINNGEMTTTTTWLGAHDDIMTWPRTHSIMHPCITHLQNNKQHTSEWRKEWMNYSFFNELLVFQQATPPPTHFLSSFCCCCGLAC